MLLCASGATGHAWLQTVQGFSQGIKGYLSCAACLAALLSSSMLHNSGIVQLARTALAHATLGTLRLQSGLNALCCDDAGKFPSQQGVRAAIAVH